MSAIPSHVSAATRPTAARVYRRRRPERAALYRLMQQHLGPWLARRRESDCDGAPIPRHVERELRSFRVRDSGLWLRPRTLRCPWPPGPAFIRSTPRRAGYAFPAMNWLDRFRQAE